MRATKVEQDQFRWDFANESLAHTPTGASFSPNKGSGDVIISWKHAADVLPKGERFDPEEIKALACRLMRVHDSS
jgi:hypothetical protein